MTYYKMKIKWIGVIILLAVALKLALISINAFPFNSDESIVALMARHILQGERPIFFYGQAYMGSLDAFLVALFFSFLGQSVMAIRLVQILLFAGTIYTTYLISRTICKSEKAGLIAAALIAFPSVNTTLYTTISLGGYGEALLIGNLILLSALSIKRHIENQVDVAYRDDIALQKSQPINSQMVIRYCLLGLLIGLGFWANALTLVYSLPACIYLFIFLVKINKKLFIKQTVSGFLALLIGLLGGGFPIELYFIRNGSAAFIDEFFGSAVSVEASSIFTKIGSHLLSFFSLGLTVILGVRPSWAVAWLMLPLFPIVLIAWGWIAYSIVKTLLKKEKPWRELLLLIGPMAFVFLGFIFTSFGVDPSGRYFLPFSVAMALLASWALAKAESIKTGWKLGIFFLLLIFNLGGNVQSALASSQAFTTQFDSSTIVDHRYDAQLIQFLESHHATRGYSNYWTAYPLDFLSSEKLIFIPALPYHQDFRYTSRDDRYAPYDTIVNNSNDVAYITVNFPELENRLRAAFTQKGITWNEEVIGDYHVFYNLSKVVRPIEIDLEGSIH